MFPKGGPLFFFLSLQVFNLFNLSLFPLYPSFSPSPLENVYYNPSITFFPILWQWLRSLPLVESLECGLDISNKHQTTEKLPFSESAMRQTRAIPHVGQMVNLFHTTKTNAHSKENLHLFFCRLEILWPVRHRVFINVNFSSLLEFKYLFLFWAPDLQWMPPVWEFCTARVTSTRQFLTFVPLSDPLRFPQGRS